MALLNGLAGLIGGEQPVKKLTPLQKDLWNDFAEKNYKSGTDTDKLFASFSKKHKNIPIDALRLELQNELSSVKDKAFDNAQVATGIENINTGMKFLKYKMPDGSALYKEQLPVTPKTNLDITQYVPSDIKSLNWDETNNLPYYTDPQSGDIKYVPQHYIHLPRFRPAIGLTK